MVKEKTLIFSFFNNIFLKRKVLLHEASEVVYMRERVKDLHASQAISYIRKLVVRRFMKPVNNWQTVSE